MEIDKFRNLVSMDKAPLHGDIIGMIKDFIESHHVPPGIEFAKTADSVNKARLFMGSLLQEVLRLEFITIPLYLNAAYSLVQRQNKIYKLMVRLAKEEMGHMTVIANLMTAIEVKPRFTGKFAPKLPGYLPLVKNEESDGEAESIWADLKSFKGTRYPVTSQDDANRFNTDVMGFFLRIELPDYEEEMEPEMLFAENVPEKPVPTTIGQLYHWLINIFDDPEYPSIRALLDDAGETTEKQLQLQQVPITGTNDMRFHPVRLYADKGARDYTFNEHACQGTFDLVIDGVEKAQDYLRWIAGEGEGASKDDPWAPSGLAAHFFRFASTLEGKQMIPTPDGGGEYAGHDLDWNLDKIVHFDTNPDPNNPNYSAKTREIMKQFDDNYSKMLKDLETSFEKEGNEKAEYYRRSSRVWMKEMGMAAKRLASHLMEENKPIGQRGGLAFRYNPNADPGPMTNA